MPPVKIATVIGARPQFVKAASVSRTLQLHGIEEILIHTGQHYDPNMSEVFFNELGIPEPSYNLEVGSGMHGKQTGEMLSGIEKILMDEKPDWVITYGDTNSTIAGALAAVKLHIKIAHIEAGLRSFNRQMPEEVNRVLTDHISNLLFCPSEVAVRNLNQEGITEGVYNVGDVMIDALKFAIDKGKSISKIFEQLEIQDKEYILVTLHRAETTDYPERLAGILEALNGAEKHIVFPVHPRTRQAIETLNLSPATHVHLIEPVGYLDMVQLEQSACFIMTDSGGIQKEAYWLKVPCITIRTETEWIETVEAGWNYLTGYDVQKIVDRMNNIIVPDEHPPLYGNQDAVKEIVSHLLSSI